MSPELILGLTLGLGTATALSIAAVFGAQGDSLSEITSPDRPQIAITVLGAPVTDEMIDAGRQIYAGNCASCHGAGLEGAPNWRTPEANGRLPAPPHNGDGHTWHHPDQDLVMIIKDGASSVLSNYRSNMPGFRAVLSQSEIEATLAFIKSHWPDDARRLQEEVTRQAALSR